MRLTGYAVLGLLCAYPVAADAQSRLSQTDEAAAFRAAGFKRVAGQWQACGDPGSASYEPGRIESSRDINGDGFADAVIVEGSSACFGMAGQGFSVVSKQAGGGWRLITQNTGIATFLPRRRPTGWPDMEIGGPGFCFPVHRWNGKAYVLNRFQYEGRPCRPAR